MNQQLAVSIASIKRAETGKVVLYRTARHLATIFDVEVERLVLRAADAAAGAAALPAVPRAAAPEPTVRFVIQLHIALAGAPEPDSEAMREIAALARQFGGQAQAPDGAQVVAGVRPAAGLPQRRRARHALRVELGRVLVVHGASAMALRLVRWEDGRAGPGEQALPDLRAAPVRRQLAPLSTPLYVARNLVGQLGGRFEFDGAPPRFPGYLHFAGIAAGDQPAPAPLIGRTSEMRQFRAVTEAALESQSAARSSTCARWPASARPGCRPNSPKSRARPASAATAAKCSTPAPTTGAPRSASSRAACSAWAPDDTGAQAIDDGMAELRLAPESAIFYRALTGARMTSEQVSLYAAMSHAVRDQGLAQALQMLIMRRAAAEPLLLAVEDVHWGDGWLFEALGALLALTREAPVVWVLTSRIEHDPLEASLRAHLFDLPLTVFDLAPLAPRDALALADQFGEVEPSYRQRCVERAQGNRCS